MKPFESEAVRIRNSATVLALAWTLIITFLMVWGFYRSISQAEKLARMEAVASFNKDLVYRRWAAGHGGVYVPATEKTPPNPYLSHIPERDITTSSGRVLTLVNPAYMTRQVHQLGQQQYGAKGHITSLNPLRPENAPDPWETQALEALARGQSEVDAIESIDGESYLRIMRPLTTEESCLKCHASQGYSVGDLRGGISVSVPMAPHWSIAKSQMLPIALGHGVLWLLGLCGITVGAQRFQKGNRERKRAEEERAKLEEQLRQSQKMEAVGQLAGGVAHDFNNLLQVMLGYVELVAREIGEQHPQQGDLEQVLKAGRRAKMLVSQLLAFSKRQILRPEYVHLNQLISNFLKMLDRMIGEHIHIEFLPGDDVGTIHADPGMIEQVLMNLCVNARDAMVRGGDLTIETRNRVFGREFRDAAQSLSPGRYAQITVTDTGCGMDSATRKRIFEPFFSTKGADKGTGLGLPTVYGIVNQHGGAIDVESEVGKGTAFHIYLPAVEDPLFVPKKNGETPPTQGKETILVAEDNDGILELSVRVLRKAEYNVIAARNGTEALEQFAAASHSVDLLLLDVAMPDMGGRELYRQINERSPGIPVIFASGFVTGAIPSSGSFAEGVQLLQKPYTSEELLEKVRLALAGRANA